MSLEDKMAELGRTLGAREAEHADGLERAQAKAKQLRDQVSRAFDRFHEAASAAGAPHLQVAISEPRLDAKHLRAIELELERGRHRAVITVKSRGEVTLVGPFRQGKDEGPCRSFPIDADSSASGEVIRLVDPRATHQQNTGGLSVASSIDGNKDQNKQAAVGVCCK